MLYRSRTKRAKDKIWHVPGIVGVMADPFLTVSNQLIMPKMCESSYKGLQLTYSQHLKNKRIIWLLEIYKTGNRRKTRVRSPFYTIFFGLRCLQGNILLWLIVRLQKVLVIKVCFLGDALQNEKNIITQRGFGHDSFFLSLSFIPLWFILFFFIIMYTY